jgi:hypothetical protein
MINFKKLVQYAMQELTHLEKLTIRLIPIFTKTSIN